MASERRVKSENLGILYLSAMFYRQEIKHIVIDQSIENISETSIIEMLNHNDICAFSIDENNYKETIDFSIKIKKLNLNINLVCGGTFVSINYYSIKKLNIFNLIVRGGNEIKISNYLRDIQKGIVFNSEVVNCEKFVKNLIPERDYYLEYYRKIGYARVLFSRGCSFNCSFCMIKEISPIWDTYTEQTVVNDIKYLIDKGIKSYIFTDDTFLGNRFDKNSIDIRLNYIENILLNFKDKNIEFRASMRPEHISENSLKRLVGLGLVGVNIGIESINTQQKKRYNKLTKVKKIYDSLDFLSKYNVATVAYMIPFDPLTNIAEIKENFAFMNTIQQEQSNITFSSPSQTFGLYRNSTYFRKYGSLIKEYEFHDNITGKISYAFNDKNVTDFYFKFIDIKSDTIQRGVELLKTY